MDRAFRKLTIGDSLLFLFGVVVPTWAKGIFLRRPRMVGLAQRFDLDTRAVRILQRFRRQYGEAALAVRKPGRLQVLLLSPLDVEDVLTSTPDPFTPASAEKTAALSHFEPHNSLITRGAERCKRRAFHDRILQSDHRVHCYASRMARIVDEEATTFLQTAELHPVRTWADFTKAWNRTIRRVVLGDGARDDDELTEMLARLRARANWVFLPKATGLRRRFHARLTEYLARGESGSLAELIGSSDAASEPADQVAQWLFASDAGAISLWRALAPLASHPAERQQAITEASSKPTDFQWPFLRGCFLEAVRLWPTTPVILREATRAVQLGQASVPENSSLIIYTPFFHRDNERRDDADRFCPAQWRDRDPAHALPLLPFSAGPAACPGRHVVILLASAWLAALCRNNFSQNDGPALAANKPLPGTLDHLSLKFRF